MRNVFTDVPVSAREAVGMGKRLLSWFGDVSTAAEIIPMTKEGSECQSRARRK